MVKVERKFAEGQGVAIDDGLSEKRCKCGRGEMR